MEKMTKRLIAKNNEPVTAYLMTDDGLKEQTFQPMCVAVDLICRSVSHDRVSKNLAESFNEEGLIDPIIVIPNTESNYLMAGRNVDKFITKHLPSFPLLAYNGNQRLTIARKLGVDTVSCIIAEDVRWAHAYQLVLQDGVIVNEVIDK